MRRRQFIAVLDAVAIPHQANRELQCPSASSKRWHNQPFSKQPRAIADEVLE